MRFYENKPDKGAAYHRKAFAWFPTGVENATVWLEYYWEYMSWCPDRKEYRSAGVDRYNLLLEEHEGEH